MLTGNFTLFVCHIRALITSCIRAKNMVLFSVMQLKVSLNGILFHYYNSMDDDSGLE